jgi:NADPH2:quinone reductase
MLNRLCLEDGIGLVNIVRKEEQRALLRQQGARHVCLTESPGFAEELTDAIAATGATLAFDATGGGRLAGTILSCMEAAVTRGVKDVGRYGSSTHKQVYVYGGLDASPTELVRNFGMAWGVGGWLLFPYLQRIGPEAVAALRKRVLLGLKTTFRSDYAREISLAEALKPEMIAAYGRRATGEKFLINPNRHA